MGTITNGYYLAPATIQAAQTVTLTATSLSNASVRASVPISLTPTAPVTVQLTPSSISLQPGQSTQFSLKVSGSVEPAAWSLVPNIGSVSNGLYTAPASVSKATSLTVMATNLTNSSQTASAAISLQASPAATVSVSLSPSSASLSSGQTANFSATVSGSSNTAVNWSLSPAVGSLSNGTYTAPATVTAQQAVTIKATSAADSTKSASATVTLIPVAITLKPGSISLAGGGSAQFTATVTGASNTGVTWSISPSVGSVTNGLYKAPATVTSAQTVTITAASVANPAKTAQAAISLTASATASLTVSPGSISLGPSKTQQFSATSSGGLGGGGPVSVTWSLNPAVGSITAAGLYTAPSSISSQQNVSVTATGGGASSSATVTLTPAQTLQGQSSTIVLPLEVMGSPGTHVQTTVSVPLGSNLSGQPRLWLQIHGLKYETEASVQVNGGAWIPINTSTIKYQDNAGLWGGIGGGFATFTVTLNLPSGSINTGNNTIVFAFNGTDGVTSGYRILNFNILAVDGTQLVSQSSFSWDNPATWQPPLNDPADIQAGQTLWKTGALKSASGTALVAKCADCHTQDGRDLKYFNYSNYSIRVRSMFHGLSAQQGDQIASYIRSLNVPAPENARPWNPPYQPGPGLDSQPVANWAAGAGLDAVLTDDAQEIPYVYPSGSNPPNLNPRETPIALQLPDWNSWLPQIAPQDSGAFNTSCNSTIGAFGTPLNLYNDYLSVRAMLGPAPATAQAYSKAAAAVWGHMAVDQGCIVQAMEKTPNWASATYAMQVHSVGLWTATKQWEINQEFGLEGMPSVGFTGTGYPRTTSAPIEPRAWLSPVLFFVSPFMQHIPRPQPGIGNGTDVAHVYRSFIWYQLQLILNDGNGYAVGTTPIDWGYALAYVSSDLPWDHVTNTFRTGTAGLMAQWFAMNQEQEPGREMLDWVTSPAVLSQISPAQRSQLLNNAAQQLWSFLQPKTPAQYCNGPCPAFTTNPDIDNPPPGAWWFELPRLKAEGVTLSTLTQWASWLSKAWPSQNWAADLAETCTQSNPPYGGYTCQ
ncbi:MAG TPA: hypothetical protein VMH05_00760 [Bryobacteraceae bacterium]|nr:hypothetical protein [Bryobacteraceae bacterium]